MKGIGEKGELEQDNNGIIRSAMEGYVNLLCQKGALRYE